MSYNNLINLRESLNMSQKEFALSLDLKPNRYNNYETGVRTPDAAFFEMVARKYSVSIDYLLDLTNDPMPYHHPSPNPEGSAEEGLVKKYRTLDDKGKHTVNVVLDMEYNRCKSAPNVVHIQPDQDYEIVAYTELGGHVETHEEIEPEIT